MMLGNTENKTNSNMLKDDLTLFCKQVVFFLVPQVKKRMRGLFFNDKSQLKGMFVV